jgi:hypothetical protein
MRRDGGRERDGDSWVGLPSLGAGRVAAEEEREMKKKVVQADDGDEAEMQRELL